MFSSILKRKYSTDKFGGDILGWNEMFNENFKHIDVMFEGNPHGKIQVYQKTIPEILFVGQDPLILRQRKPHHWLENFRH